MTSTPVELSPYDPLLRPITLGTMTIPNRVVLLPMGTEMGTHEGLITDREIAYYTERARGGVGLVMTGIAAFSQDFEQINEGLCRVDTDAAIPGLTALAESIHAAGAKVSLQLTAGLGRNINVVNPDRPPISASDNPHYADPSVLCRPLTVDEIQLLVQRAGEAAARAALAGIDAIDIHGHTGYLIDQFMSPVWNRRTDEYGGSVEARCRFAVEIIQAVKKAAPGLPVSFRLSVDHRFPGGRTAEESRKIAVILEAAGLDFILADDGSYEAMDYVFPPYYLGDGCMVSAAEALKEVVSIPVVACGNLDPDTAVQVLNEGKADIAGVGRGLIADPEWVNKLAQGRREDIRPCIRCNAMCVGNAFFALPLGCAVNPQVGLERERVITPAPVSKHVVVVGGGPGGLEAARVAGLRGHQVDLYEKNDLLGGVLLPAATPEFKKELKAMISWWERQLAQLPVTIHTGVELRADSPEIADADEVIVATGSVPIEPASIGGLDSDQVVSVLDAHNGAPLGHRVVVLGGGLSGADLALELALEGHEVTIVEMGEGLARDLIIINRMTLLRQLADHNVTVLTNHTVTQVTSGAVVATHDGQDVVIDADTVISAFGVAPNKEFQEAAQAQGRTIVAVGDCVTPAKVGEAINAGFAAACEL